MAEAPISTKPRPVAEVAAELGLLPGEVELYGSMKAKISLEALNRVKGKTPGHLILVTGMTATPAGEGKTTTAIGLGDGLQRIGKRAVVCLREPSMGPCFGIKGGATGGGLARVIPAADINLHFTGDAHAVTAAHNLLATLVDNHLYYGNALKFDPRHIILRRVMDMNDRSLRKVVASLTNNSYNGLPRETGFDITASSEIMAILCLSESISELKEKLGRIIVGFSVDGAPITAKDLKANGAMAAILKDAIKPNLVQTLSGTPALIHGGPFANIAHGCNSLLATRMGLHLADYVVTEAGFATDLGAEKFFDIKCRFGNLKPEAAVIVASIRAIKMHGGMAKESLDRKGLNELKAGFANLAKHIENIRFFGVPCVVALNVFSTDHPDETVWLEDAVAESGVTLVPITAYDRGPVGGVELAHAIIALIDKKTAKFDFLYPIEMPLVEKLHVIARCCYGADGVEILKAAREQLIRFEKLGFRHLPVCIAKTQHSLSDNPALLGRPQGFKILVREVKLAAGAGFVIAITGDIMTMPGLPKNPAAEKIDVDDDGNVTGMM